MLWVVNQENLFLCAFKTMLQCKHGRTELYLSEYFFHSVEVDNSLDENKFPQCCCSSHLCQSAIVCRLLSLHLLFCADKHVNNELLHVLHTRENVWCHEDFKTTFLLSHFRVGMRKPVHLNYCTISRFKTRRQLISLCITHKHEETLPKHTANWRKQCPLVTF